MKPKLLKRAVSFAKRRTLSARLAIPNLLVRSYPPEGRPIAVIGNGRSGTSWIGETIGSAPGVVYYREPCHPQVRYRKDDSVWSRYVPVGGSDADFERCLDLAFRGGMIGDVDLESGGMARRSGGGYRVVVKEVAAFLSAEWLCERYDPHVVFATRHPCPSAMSVHKLGLVGAERRRLKEILAVPELREGRLKPYLGHLEALESPLEVSAGIWAIKNHVALGVAGNRGDWIHVAYEDACLRPVEVFRDVFERLELPWDGGMEAHVIGSTSTAAAGPHATSKISAAQVDGWRTKMNRDEKELVRRVVEPFDFPFYNAPDDWL